MKGELGWGRQGRGQGLRIPGLIWGALQGLHCRPALSATNRLLMHPPPTLGLSFSICEFGELAQLIS